MNDDACVRELGDGDRVRVVGLVELVHPRVPGAEVDQHLDRVRARQRTGEVAGAQVLADPQGYLYGFFCYRVESTLALGRHLLAEDFCVAALGSEAQATASLMAAAEALAHAHGCLSLCVKFLGRTRDAPAEVIRQWPDLSYFQIPAVAKVIQ